MCNAALHLLYLLCTHALIGPDLCVRVTGVDAWCVITLDRYGWRWRALKSAMTCARSGKLLLCTLLQLQTWQQLDESALIFH